MRCPCFLFGARTLAASNRELRSSCRADRRIPSGYHLAITAWFDKARDHWRLRATPNLADLGPLRVVHATPRLLVVYADR